MRTKLAPPLTKASSTAVCRGCAAPAGRIFTATERMFNLGGRFEYNNCEHCGSLSLVETPKDLGKYYPPNAYYSFSSDGQKEPGGLRRLVNTVYDWLLLYRRLDVRSIRRIVPSPTARILDVGAGGGAKLELLWNAGIQQLMGIDPFLPPELERETPFPLRRCTIADAGGNWDLIMYHHVMEHIENPSAEIGLAAAQLAKGGHLLIRVPVADSWAFSHYRAHWVQLDPPRHLWIPTRRALIGIARKHGLEFVSQSDDSTAFQIWASELYAHTQYALHGAPPFGGSPRERLKKIPKLASQTLFSAWLNLIRRGDQTCLIFKKMGATKSLFDGS